MQHLYFFLYIHFLYHESTEKDKFNSLLEMILKQIRKSQE